MDRPSHLVQYNSPPLDEVVLGVQFSTISGFSSVLAREIWELFKKDYPNTQDQPLIEQAYELFGGANVPSGPQIRIGPPPVGNRLWFSSADNSHLLQFQPDRFILNWRGHQQKYQYPRFEGIAREFKKNLEILSKHCLDNFQNSIEINQAEVTYVNIIPVTEFSEIGEWFSLLNVGDLNISTFSSTFDEVVYDSKNVPFARLIFDIQSVLTPDGKNKAVKLSISFKGKPVSVDIASSMEFLELGREKIVTRFAEITTSSAHKYWEKI